MDRPKKYAARVLRPGWCGTREVDEDWMAEWVAYGIAELERVLTNQARYQQWLRDTGRDQ